MNKDLALAVGVVGAMFPNQTQYLNDVFPMKFKSAPNKVFSNCPCCGKQRVNIYWRNGTWKCLKCWNSEVQL